MIHPHQLSGMYPMALSSQDVRELLCNILCNIPDRRRRGIMGLQQVGPSAWSAAHVPPAPYVSTANARILVIATLLTCISS